MTQLNQSYHILKGLNTLPQQYLLSHIFWVSMHNSQKRKQSKYLLSDKWIRNYATDTVESKATVVKFQHPGNQPHHQHQSTANAYHLKSLGHTAHSFDFRFTVSLSLSLYVSAHIVPLRGNFPTPKRISYVRQLQGVASEAFLGSDPSTKVFFFCRNPNTRYKGTSAIPSSQVESIGKEQKLLD